jgi:HEAT repeat protein
MIAVLGPEQFEARCHAAVAHLMSAADPRVRLRAVVAAAALGWREFIPQIKGIAVSDSTDYVRWRATDVLAAFSRTGL